jgi:hypothetical protein
VLPEMVGQMLLSSESFVAKVASVRRLPGVDSDVIHEVLLSGERFRTKMAPEIYSKFRTVFSKLRFDQGQTYAATRRCVA